MNRINEWLADPRIRGELRIRKDREGGYLVRLVADSDGEWLAVERVDDLGARFAAEPAADVRDSDAAYRDAVGL